MFLEFRMKDEFYKQYIQYFIERFTYSSVEIEKTNNEERLRQMKLYAEAFTYILDLPYDKIGLTDIKLLGDIVNRSAGISGFRKINVLSGSDFVPAEPRQIQFLLMSLLDNYYNIWSDLDIYEREARFNIEFMRIHPFEDGNKRISKLILNSNLCKNDCAPVIITNEDTEMYYNFINNQDYAGFAQFLKQRSNIELNTMVGLYKLINNIGIEKTGETLIENDIPKK